MKRNKRTEIINLDINIKSNVEELIFFKQQQKLLEDVCFLEQGETLNMFLTEHEQPKRQPQHNHHNHGRLKQMQIEQIKESCLLFNNQITKMVMNNHLSRILAINDVEIVFGRDLMVHGFSNTFSILSVEKGILSSQQIPDIPFFS